MRTQEAFEIPLLELAYKLNFKFSRTYINKEWQKEHVFHNPNRADKTASLYINPIKNVAYDNGGNIEGGGIIWFISYTHGLNTKDTRQVLKILDWIFPEFKTPWITKNFLPVAPAGGYDKKEKNTFSIVEVKTLFSYPLKNYLVDERKIDLKIALEYTKEIKYKHNEKNINFYGIWFKSWDTRVLRRKKFKGFLWKGADITTIDKKTDTILIFEWFIDFLTYLTIKKKLNYSVIILNSVIFTNRACDYINNNKGIKKICYYRDNDESWFESFLKLEKWTREVIIEDMVRFYSKHKDLNEAYTNECKRT